ncbi:MAG: hypothetical protein ACK4Y6_03460 [Bacteroidota bacterium]|jgi:antitoxin component YwqK of YwqJK toxin-antitoxin module
MINLKWIAGILIALSLSSQAQVIDDVAGKTYFYYDSLTNRKIKEIYHHKQVVKIIPDKKNYGEYRDTMYYLKNGPYTRYYENGTLECSGYYTDEKKDSLWKHYSPKGDLIRTERWVKGQQIRY